MDVASHHHIIRFSAGDAPIFAIGDLHGRRDILAALLSIVKREATADARLVLTGDLIDRGPDSLGTLDLARSASARTGLPTTVLMGNHEQMLLIGLGDMSARQDAAFEAWLTNGGSVFAEQAVGTCEPTAQAVRQALGDRVDWMRTMRSQLRVCDVVFVHAGLSPIIDPDTFLATPWDLDIRALCEDNHWAWIREPFLTQASHHGAFVVHGHTPTDGVARRGAETVANDRLNLDLGSAKTGRARLAKLVGHEVTCWDVAA